LIADQSTRSFSTEVGAGSKTAYVVEGAYIIETTDMYGDGICCQYCAGEFITAVNGEPVATSSSGDVVLLREELAEGLTFLTT
jgi:hypothetical protein